MSAKKNPYNLPTEEIDIPSKGLTYPTDHILSPGKIEVLIPGALQEDILTNANYLNKGVAVDKFLESILITEVDMNDMLPGDKDAFMIAARILGLGRKYTTHVRINRDPEVVTFDLGSFKEREIDWSLFQAGVNEFPFKLETGTTGKFKLLSIADTILMEEEAAGIRKVNPDYSADTSLYLKFSIIEINGIREVGKIRAYVDRMPMTETRELKAAILDVTPGYIWKADGVRRNKEVVEDLSVPYTADFFWPALKS